MKTRIRTQFFPWNTIPRKAAQIPQVAGAFVLLLLGGCLVTGTSSPQDPVPEVIANNPVITAQPHDASVAPGGTAIFTVTATGNGLSYEWLRGAAQAAVPGATQSTLTLPNITEIFDGMIYRCVVRNESGSDTTVPVRVLVEVARPVLLDTGETIYAIHCAECHGADGRGGNGATPPVANADFVQNRSNASLKMILQGGITGPITVNGIVYSGGSMPAFADILSNVEIAGVLTYLQAVLNDSTVTNCDTNTFVCQKTARTAQEIAQDSVSIREVRSVRDSLSPL